MYQCNRGEGGATGDRQDKGGTPQGVFNPTDAQYEVVTVLQFTFPFSSLASTQSHLILSSPRNHHPAVPSPQPPCHPVTLSPYHLITLSPCHLLTSPLRHKHSPSRHPIDLSLYCPRLVLVPASSLSSPSPHQVLVSSPISKYP